MNCLTAALWLLTATLSACAQGDSLAELHTAPGPEAVEPSRVYTYVEQMPQLPGSGGTQAVAMELMKRIRLPAIDFLHEQYNGSATVYFEVSSSGAVQHVKLLRATGSASADSALTTAAKTLPPFTPGYQDGRPVTVSYTIPFSCFKPQ